MIFTGSFSYHCTNTTNKPVILLKTHQNYGKINLAPYINK